MEENFFAMLYKLLANNRLFYDKHENNQKVFQGKIDEKITIWDTIKDLGNNFEYIKKISVQLKIKMGFFFGENLGEMIEMIKK